MTMLLIRFIEIRLRKHIRISGSRELTTVPAAYRVLPPSGSEKSGLDFPHRRHHRRPGLPL